RQKGVIYMQLKMYINGKWRAPSNRPTREVINPANGEVIARAVDGTVDDTREAIHAARKTFDKGEWSSITNEERSRILWNIAEKIEEDLDEISELEMLDNGKPLREAKVDVQDAADCFRYYASIIRNSDGETFHTSETLDTIVIREPIGV